MIVSLPTTPALFVPLTLIKVTSEVSGTLTVHGLAAPNEPLAPALVCHVIVPVSDRFVPPIPTEEVPAGKAAI